ncbi:uncharacterized protein LOC100180411 [Ciona intestinalis]
MTEMWEYWYGKMDSSTPVPDKAEDNDGQVENTQSCEVKQTKQVFKFNSMQEAKQAIQEFEKATHMKYVFFRKKYKKDVRSSFLRWSNEGIPYVIKSFRKYECEYGKDRCKRKNLKTKKTMNHHLLGSKKRNCQASISVRELIAYPDYKLEFKKQVQTKSQKDQISRKLKSIGLLSVPCQTTFNVEFPTFDEHSGHQFDQLDKMNSDALDELDSKVVEHLDVLIDQRVPYKQLMKELKLYVVNVLFKDRTPPVPNNRHFFPTKKTLYKYHFLYKQKTGQNRKNTNKRNRKKTEAQTTSEAPPTHEDPATAETLDPIADPAYVTFDHEIVCAFQHEGGCDHVHEIQDAATDVYLIQPDCNAVDTAQQSLAEETFTGEPIHKLMKIVDGIKDVLQDMQLNKSLQEANDVLCSTFEYLKQIHHNEDAEMMETFHSTKRKRQLSTSFECDIYNEGYLV